MECIYRDSKNNLAYELEGGRHFIDLNGNQFILTKETYEKIVGEDKEELFETIRNLNLPVIRNSDDILGLASIIESVKNKRILDLAIKTLENDIAKRLLTKNL